MEESNYELAIDHSIPGLESNPIEHRSISRTSVSSRCSSIPTRSCRICLSSIHDAAFLTCGHEFCEGCLVKYWDVKDRPDYIVCPLCRACAYNIDFTKKEALPSKEDFRKTFNLLENIPETEENRTSIRCLKISMLMPAVYYALKWLKLPFTHILAFLNLGLRRS